MKELWFRCAVHAAIYVRQRMPFGVINSGGGRGDDAVKQLVRRLPRLTSGGEGEASLLDRIGGEWANVEYNGPETISRWATLAIAFGTGTCSNSAGLAFKYLEHNQPDARPLALMSSSDYPHAYRDDDVDNHAFVVIGAVDADCTNWSDNVIVCDPWMAETVRDATGVEDLGVYKLQKHLSLMTEHLGDGTSVVPEDVLHLLE